MSSSIPRYQALKLLHRFVVRYPWRITVGLVMAIAGTLLGYVFPGLTQWFLDDIIPNQKFDEIWYVSLIALGAMAIRQVFYSLRTLANNAFELTMTYDLRGELHRKLQAMSLKWHDRQQTGDILTRMADDVPATQRVAIDGIDQGVPAVLQIVLTAGYMFYLHPALATVILLPVPLIAAGGWFYAKWVAPQAYKARQAASSLNSLLHDHVRGIRQTKSYTVEKTKQEEFDKRSEFYKTQQTKLQRAWSIYGPGMGFLGDAGLVLLMGFGSYWCIQDALTLKQMVAQNVDAQVISQFKEQSLTIGRLAQFLLFMGMFYEPIGRLHGINQTFVNGLVSARRVFEMLELEEEEDLDEGKSIPSVKGHIQFQKVGFSYDGSRKILQDMDFEVLPGQTVAIVGGTGAGKTTLFQLLTRFYDPEEGVILLDGVNLQDFKKRELRQQIGYVTQESYIFDQSIRENLRLGNPEATDEMMWTALEKACAKDFIQKLERGLDATVGENGSKLSGGEKQRLSVARAFLKNSPILLLDEATSAVDNRSERLIQRAIDELRQDRTCLVIAHRLSTVIHADRIYVLRDGKILGSGKHEELMQTLPYYAELANLSFQEEKLSLE